MWDIHDRLHGHFIQLTLRSVPVVRSYRSACIALAGIRSGKKTRILHAQFGSLVGALSAFLRADRRIISLRGSDSHWRYGSFSDRVGGLLRVALSWIGCLRSDAIVVMSYAMAKRVARWPLIRGRPVHVIADPAGGIFWPEQLAELADALRQRPFTVLIASLVDDNPVKRLQIVADAACLCQAVGMNLSLTMLSGVTRAEVKERILKSDSVALASTHEGWPNIIKETMILGRPFVSTAVSDLARWAGPSTQNHIVNPTPLDFAFAWVDQIAALELEKGNVSPALAAFHPDVCVLKHELLYHAVSGQANA